MKSPTDLFIQFYKLKIQTIKHGHSNQLLTSMKKRRKIYFKNMIKKNYFKFCLTEFYSTRLIKNNEVMEQLMFQMNQKKK